MKKIKIWIKAIRAQFFTAVIVPVILGAVIAWYQFGNFNWLYFLLSLIGGIFVNAGLNLINDYFDHTSGTDEVNRFITPFSGGSRMIQNKLLKPKEIYVGGILCFIVTIIIGLYLNFVLPGNILLIIGIIGIFLAYFYTADPFRIGYTGFGELCVGVGFGPIMVLGSYYVQCNQILWLPFWASIPVGILIFLVLYINEFPDYEADKTVNKNTLVVILGKTTAIKIYYFLLVLSYLWIIIGIIFKIFPLYSLIALITVPLCIKAIKIAKLNYDKIYELLPANALIIALHLIIGLLLSLSYIVDKLLNKIL